MCGYRVQTSAECITVMAVMLTITSGLRSSLHLLGSIWRDGVGFMHVISKAWFGNQRLKRMLERVLIW
jgi:hypothetical protein